MPKEPKVIDVEPVGRGPQVRRAFLLLLFAAVVAGLYIFYTRTNARGLKESADATAVRSTVYPAGDSLEVAVDWKLAIDSLRAIPESVRVEVGLSGGQVASVSTQSADLQSDTLRVVAPAPGQTASGYSCVAPIHRGQLRRESCTPWQFVRPTADTAAATGPAPADTTAAARRRTTAAAQPRVTRIVVQPSGLQVDPDVGGRCARWQRDNPGRNVWVEVNRRAVPECTGLNGKPVVAQFCAFAELSDGRRVKTENSAHNRYCEQLYQEWAGERVS
ncbi:MAG TPA: hypothetical protein VFT84_00480 [Gemmatimonadales bacterium]|nr:hypothetical protein [Gemmatimonadales bacterium]